MNSISMRGRPGDSWASVHFEQWAKKLETDLGVLWLTYADE